MKNNRSSIDYARSSVKKKDFQISYEYKNYLELDEVESFEDKRVFYYEHGVFLNEQPYLCLESHYRYEWYVKLFVQ